MDKRDLKKLSKSQLIKMLMEREEKKPEIIVVDDTKKTKKPKQQKKVYNHGSLFNDDPFPEFVVTNNPFENRMIKATNKGRDINEQTSYIDKKYKSIMSSLDDVKPSPKPSERPIPKPRTYKPVSAPRFNKLKYKARPPVPTPRNKVNQLVQHYETDIIEKPVPTPRLNKPKYKPRPPVPTPRNKVNQLVQHYENNIIEKPVPKPVPRKSVNEDIILTPPKGFRDRPPKPTRAPPLPPNDGFNFDDDIFQTENTSLGKFKIVGIRNRENKKFKSYTNEFRVKVLKELDDDNEIYHIFQELVKTVKKRRKLSNNDMIRLVIQNEELPNAISTKFNKVESFKLGDLENIINIMEYRGIPLETSKIIVQSVKIPTGKGRLYLTKDTISRKGCIITVKKR